MGKPRWWPLFTTNYLGVLNDNFLKTLACFICVAWVGLQYEGILVTSAAAALVLPYVFCSPLAGRWAIIFNKRKVVQIAKSLEIAIMILASLGFYFQWVWMILLCILLMGLQSCLFSPSKYGLIRDIGGQEQISYGTGIMEMVSFLGMLSGTLLASFLSFLDTRFLSLILFGIACAGYATSLAIRVDELPTQENSDTLRPFKYLLESYKMARTIPGLNGVIGVLSIFWFIAGMIQMTLLVFCRRDMLLTDFQTGLMLTLAAIGTGIGCYSSGIISRHGNRRVLTMITGSGAALFFLLLYLFSFNTYSFGALMLVTGCLCGLFKVPFDTAIIEKVPGRALGRMLAYSNQLSFLFILGASGAFALITGFMENRHVFLFLAIVLAFTTLYISFSKYIWRPK